MLCSLIILFTFCGGAQRVVHLCVNGEQSAVQPIRTAIKLSGPVFRRGLVAGTPHLLLGSVVGEGYKADLWKRKGDGQAFSCSWLWSRRVLWSLHSEQATTPNTKVSANGTLRQ